MTTIDYIVIAVVVISALIAFLRGFVREVLTVGSWLGAALIALYGFPLASPYFEKYINNKVAAHASCGFTLFIVSLVVLSMISHQIAKFVRGSALTAVDRSLGLLFGLARGAILVSLAYMIVQWLAPDLASGARTQPMMARGADILRNMAPKELADELSAELPALPPAQANGDKKQEAQKAPAYNDRQKDALQRLIDATGGK